jgi:transposase
MMVFVGTMIVSTRWIVDTSQQAIQVRGRESKRRFRTTEEKRRIVEETFQPGASVARVARAHGVNANQVFTWRRLYQQGGLESKVNEAPSLLPVRVIGAAVVEAGRSTAAARRTPSGMIHVELPKGQLRIAGRVDAEALREVLEKLLG